MKILAFAGSPRRHGNSETLLDWVLESMGEESDVEIQKIALTEVNINPCRGCNACEVTGRCVQRDDMDRINDLLLEADGIVLAAPIFCMSINAQAKALIDRMQVHRSRKYVLRLPLVPPEKVGRRMGVFLSTAGQTWENVFDGALPPVRCFFHLAAVRDQDVRYLMISGVDGKGEIVQHPTAREQARQLGKDVIGRLREMKAA
ncbi:MAG: flavodoxin family protein [Methanomicrobiales archaeon]|nr:flavodoxin family protein [Methanomicrobiales archaeon]